MKTIKKIFSTVAYLVLIPVTAVAGFSIAVPSYLAGVTLGFARTGFEIGLEFALRVAKQVAQADDVYKG